MTFPTSFETQNTIWRHRGSDVDALGVSTRLADLLVRDGAIITSRDDTYFEYRFGIIRPPGSQPLRTQPIQGLIRRGTIVTRSDGLSIVVDAEVWVRLAPAVLLMSASGMIAFIAGLPAAGGVGSLVATGAFLALIYNKARSRFTEYLEILCHRAK